MGKALGLEVDLLEMVLSPPCMSRPYLREETARKSRAEAQSHTEHPGSEEDFEE